MFGGAEEEDADFLSPTGGARLASLFGIDQTASGTGNEFFQYTAPKQPKKNQLAPAAGPPTQKPPPPSAASGAPSVFIATAVHAYRLTNGNYVKQGKYGAAVVGSHSNHEYRILLYINQQQQITSARIHPGFVFTVQPNNYSTFYDDQRQNWSILFESEKAAMDFSKQLCIARYNSSPSPDSVVSQDLTVGEGPGVDVGDALEISFTGWLFQNSALGQVFDSNVNKDKLLRLKLGSGKVIKGWEEGMVGLKKGGRRFLLVPAGLAYGPQGVANRVPPDSTLAFEVEVKRVRLAKEAAPSGQGLAPGDSLAPPPGPNTENLLTDPSRLSPDLLPPKPGETALRAKSNSISEQLVNPSVAKAKLISRMAKMGQPMLPFLPGSTAAQPDSSDSEIEDPNALREAPPLTSSPLKPSPPAALLPMAVQVPPASVPGLQASSTALMPATLHPHPSLPGTAQTLQTYTGMNYAYSQSTVAASQLQPVGPMYPAPFQGASPSYSAAGDISSFLVTEARQQNTELRLAVGKVADKMDQLTSKVEDLQKQNTAQSLLPSISSVTMETAVIMSNIQRIMQENERLKLEVFEKSSRIEEQNEKISELIDRNQRYVEQSNLLMEQRNNSLQINTEHSQARVLHAEQEKVKVAEELTAATGQISRLQLELTSHQKKEMDLRSQLNAALKEAERHATQLNQLQTQLAELQESSADTKSKFQAEKQSRKELDGKAAALEEELADLRAEKENLEKHLSERKKKSLMERKQAEEEADEIRKLYQEELDKLQQSLKKARAPTVNVASEQQKDLESQYEARYERLLGLAKEQHARQFQEVCEQRDAQQQMVSQLEEKIALLKASSEDKKLLELQEQVEELEAIKGKYTALQSQLTDLTARYEARIQELEKGLERTPPAASAEEVKKIMNGVFQSLRGQFELEESYTGRVVLGIVLNTIKTVTLQLLERHKEKGERSSEEEHQASPETVDRGRRSNPEEPSEAAPPVPSDRFEGGQRGPVSLSLGGSLGKEAAVGGLDASADSAPAVLTPVAKSSPEVEIGPGVKDREAATAGQTETPALDGSGQKEARSADPAPSKPAANETAPVSDPDGKEASGGLGVPPSLTLLSSPVGEKPTPSPSPRRGDSRVPQDEGGLLRAPDAKLPTSAAALEEEEEEEEELSLKGRPPPTPLFGDDEDDNDLDWLG